jgi:hypothetical protein
MTSGGHHTVTVSGDGKAMSVTFDDLEVGIGDPDLQSSRTWELDLPLTGAVAGRSLRVYVSGYALTADHVSATPTVSACGHRQTVTYEPGSDDEFVLALPSIALTSGLTGCHVEVTLDVVQGRASTDSSDGYLNVAALDAELV